MTSAVDLPEVVARYQRAHDAHDTEGALAAFAADATVADDGQVFHGTAEIRHWLATAASEFTFTRTLLSVESVGDGAWLVVNHIAGNFPGGQVDLRYQFTLDGDLISVLEIAP